MAAVTKSMEYVDPTSGQKFLLVAIPKSDGTFHTTADGENAVNVLIGGAASGVNIGTFIPSQYGTAALATSTTAASETIPDDVTVVQLANTSLTAAEYILYAYGSDTTDAETNLAAGGSGVMIAGGDRVIGIPTLYRDASAGFAWKSASGTPALSRIYGIMG